MDHIKSRAAGEQELEDLLVPELEETADADLPGNGEPELEALLPSQLRFVAPVVLEDRLNVSSQWS